MLRPGSILLGLLVSVPAWTQSYQGGIRGAVSDQAGAVVVGAKVTLADESAGVTRSTLTSETGEYVFNQVVPATYSVIAEAPGFKRFERKGVAIATQQFITLDLKLELGAVTESVQVTEELPLLESSTASTGQVIDRRQLIDLPNLGRNPFMMSKIAQNATPVGNPGYNRMQDQSGSSQITIAGGPVRGNNYLLDGIPITDALNRAIIIPSLEAVEEVKIQASTYDAEMARTGGGMFNTFLKSGGNDYHGSAFGYIRQTEWLANTFFNNRAGIPISPQPFRNWGASLGGRISIPKLYDGKNRTFFWAAWEAYADTQANSALFATPTLAERSGDFSKSLNRAGGLQTIYDPLTTRSNGSGGFIRDAFAGNIIPSARIDTVGRNIAATFMNPARDARFYGDQNLNGAATLPSKADQKTIKGDHQVLAWWRASASYLRYYSLEPGETWFPTVSSPNQWRLERRVDSTQINNLLTPTPTTVINIRYGFNRFPNYGFQRSQGFDVASLGFANSFVRDIPSQTFPNITMESVHSMGTNNNFYYVHHSKNFSTSLSKFIGRHSFKAGFDFRRINADGQDFGNSSGAFTFNDIWTRATPTAVTAGTGADLASMLLGLPSSGSGFIPTTLRDYADYYAWYIHDDFRVSSKLTLNLGLRWEREYGLREANNGLITGFDANAQNPLGPRSGFSSPGVVQFAGVNGASTSVGNPNLNKFGPRVGLAWQMTDKMTVRGGYGIYWAPQFAIGAPLSPEGFTASTPYIATFDNYVTPANVLSNPFPSGLNKPVGTSLGAMTGVGRSLTLPDPYARSPRVQQYSIDVQRQMLGGMVLSLSYVGSKTANLVLGTANINVNQLNPSNFSLGSALNDRVANPFFGKGGTGVVGGSTITRAQLLKPFPAFDQVNFQFSDRNRAVYHSMVVKLQKRFSQGLSLLSTWTWSQTMDASSGGAGNNLNGGNVGPQNAYDMNAEYSLSNIHTPHRWSTAFTYELPFGKGKSMLASSKALDYIVGGWSVNAISVFQSGFPLQIRQNANNNSVTGAASQRPNATGVSPEVDAEFGKRLNGWINPAAFSTVPQFAFGNVSRAISMRGPGQANWDISVFKTFSFAEKYRAQFRAEALNALNTPLFRAPNTAFGNSAFGQVTSQANFPRLIQLGLRFYF